MPRRFNYGARAVPLPTWAQDKLDDLIDESPGVTSNPTVSSTFRTPADQARIMFDQVYTRGSEKTYGLYGSDGDKVVDEYMALPMHVDSRAADGEAPDQQTAIAAMLRAIMATHPAYISHHTSNDPHATNFVEGDIVTFDVEPSTFANNNQRQSFYETAKQWETDGKIHKFIYPPKDAAYHIEFPKSGWSEPDAVLAPETEEALERAGESLKSALPYVAGGAAVGGVGSYFAFGIPDAKNWWKWLLAVLGGGAVGGYLAPEPDTGEGDEE